MWEQAVVGGIAIWAAARLAKEAVAVTRTGFGEFTKVFLSGVVMLQAIVMGVLGYFLLLYSLYMYIRVI